MFEILTSREVEMGGLLDQARNAYRIEHRYVIQTK